MNRVITGDLELPIMLRQLVEAARELLHARYGAMRVVGPDGAAQLFIHVGMDDDVVRQIGAVPRGAGILAVPRAHPSPIRLADIAQDSRCVGFPPHHPVTRSFLSVPVQIRDEVLGTLFLTGHDDDAVSVEDEELVTSLAATAAVAIENARLFAESRRRQDWLQASTEVTRQLLSSEGAEPLQVIAHRVQQIAAADAVNVVLPASGGQRLMVEVATGAGAEQLTALTYAADRTVSGLVLQSGLPVLIGDMAEEELTVHLSDFVPIGPLMVLPLVGTQRPRGALVVGRLQGRPRFTEADMEMATAFANHAAVALELSDARADQERVVLLEDRDRIARDMHDHVIQRLFGAGLTVESVAAGLGEDTRAARLGQVVLDLDETIRHIRTSIFQLRGPLGPETGAVRAGLLAVSAEVTEALGFAPQVSFVGPVDAVVSDALLDDLVAVAREGLTNVARHAHASSVDMQVSVNGEELSLRLTDDGIGVGDAERSSGLANMRQRAEHRNGRFLLVSPVADPDRPAVRGGTSLTWTIPLT